MFKVSAYADLSSGQPGMLIPVLTSTTSNLPFAQQTDEYFRVKDFQLFLDYERYEVVDCSKNHSVALGDMSIIAFRGVDSRIFSGSISDAMLFLEGDGAKNLTNVSLSVQLNRILAAGYSESLLAWQNFCNATFENESQKKLWIEAESDFFEKEKLTWEAIDPLEPESHSGLGNLTQYGTSYLLEWLANRRNYKNLEWIAVWLYVSNNIPFDERIIGISENWLYASDDSAEAMRLAKPLLYFLVDYVSQTEADPEELSDFILDKLVIHPYLIFDFVRPLNQASLLWRIILRSSRFEVTLPLIAFYLHNVPKSEKILYLMQRHVDDMPASSEASEPILFHNKYAAKSFEMVIGRPLVPEDAKYPVALVDDEAISRLRAALRTAL